MEAKTWKSYTSWDTQVLYVVFLDTLFLNEYKCSYKGVMEVLKQGYSGIV